MRRIFFSLAFLTLAATGPMQAFGGDREIAEQIIQRLKVQRDAGTLKGFTLDLKVEEGVVLMRGRVSAEQQKASVMAATDGIDGVREVVDEISIANVTAPAQPAATPEPTTVVAQSAKPAAAQEEGFSFREALAAAAEQGTVKPRTPEISPAIAANRGEVVPAAANEEEASDSVADRAITASVVKALGQAQQDGRLRGFGVDVTTRKGDVWLTGRASNDSHKALIMELAQRVPGVSNVIDDITVYAAKPLAPNAPVQPVSQRTPKQPANLQPVAVEPAAARPVSNMVDQGPIAAAAPYQMPQGAPQQYAPASYGGMYDPNCPVPAAPYAAGAGTPYAAGAAAPRYDQPYMPNYAWPGYAAYPNYAAVTYPQQYSPSAWPYIGPFYPYPQVPLGWRKVSLEWDDGWWFLDFTDR